MRLSRKEILDQSLHAAFAVAAGLCFLVIGGGAGGALAGAGIGALAEIKEEGATVTTNRAFNAVLRSWKDILFYTIGGFIVGVTAG